MRKNRFLAAILMLVLLAQMFAVGASAAKQEEEGEEINLETPFVPVYAKGSYGEFLQDNARTLDDVDFHLFKNNDKYNVGKYGFYPKQTESGIPGVPVTYLKAASEGVKPIKVTDEEKEEKYAIWTDDTSVLEWTINVPSAGIYVLGIDYMADKELTGTIEREVYVNNELQYTEARTAALDRYYVDQYAFCTKKDGGKLDNVSQRFEPKPEFYYDIDSEENESRGKQIQRGIWRTNYTFRDSSGAYTVPLKFYLRSGENTIRLEGVRGKVAISDIYVYTHPVDTSYTDYLYVNKGKDVNIADVKDWAADPNAGKLQAEFPTAKSDPMLFATFDRASASTEPPASVNIKLNIVGGERWQTVGQWIEYTIDNIPKEGFYKIAIRYRQNLSAGLFTSREITVNNGENFDEYTVQFPYGGNWEVTTPTDEAGDASLFYFNKGTNTIKLKAVTGKLTDMVNACEGIVTALQQDYTKITAITSSDPDAFQDYDLEKTIPEVISDLKSQGDMLNQIYHKLLDELGEEGQYTAQLNQIVGDLYTMYANPDSISDSTGGLRNLNSAISALGDFVSTCRLQPIEIDYIQVLPVDAELPAPEGEVINSILHQFKMFFASFFQDLNSITGEGHPEYEDEAEIWTTLSRDYAILSRQLIDRNFVHQYGVNIMFRLFPGNLTNSLLAGQICDAQTGIGPGSITDMAARHMMIPINNFVSYDKDVHKINPETGERIEDENDHVQHIPGFKEIKSRYDDSFWPGITLEMFRDYDDESKGVVNLTYGVPEVLSFSLLYYRDDVVKEYGIEVPQHWDQYFDLIPMLQKYNMQTDPPTYQTLMYQYGGTMYKYENSKQINARAVNVDSDLFLEVFDKVNSFYTEYKCPITFDGNNRFKTGEMPIMQGSLSTWKSLYTSAPEIRGLWKFAPWPGIEQEDGSINREQIPAVSYSVMYTDGVHRFSNREPAWEFIQWFNSYDCSNEYGREIEALIGQVERYSSAVRTAFQMAPWTADELEVLMYTWDTFRPAEVCFGDYYSGRYIDFARTEVIVDGVGDGHEQILSHIKEMNKSIADKRSELNLPD